MRSAGAELEQSPDAELLRSVENLQGEIAAIADALEEVAGADRRAAGLAAEHASAPPDAELASGESAQGKDKSSIR